MKRTLIAGLVVLVGLTMANVASAQNQMYEFRAGTLIDLSGDQENKTVPVEISLGYNLSERLQWGGYVSLVKKKWESYWGVGDLWGLGLYGEYSFEPWGNITPYAGAALGYINNDDEDVDLVYKLDIRGGGKLALTETIAVSAQLNIHWAGEEIYGFDRVDAVTGDGSNMAISSTIAMRFLLW